MPTNKNFYVVDHPAGVVVENLWVFQDYSLHLVRGEREEIEEVGDVLVEAWHRVEVLQLDAVLQDNSSSVFTFFR